MSPRHDSPATPSGEHADELVDELVIGEAVALDVRAASFVLRAAGAIIDVLAYVAFLLLLLLGIGALFEWAPFDDAIGATLSIAALVTAVVIVPMVVETMSAGRSLGKLAIGARIVRDDGGAITLRHAFIRALTGVLEVFLTFGGLAAVVGLLSGRAKRLGDLLAGTYSQHERVPRVPEHVLVVPQPLQKWAGTADVARMPDGLSRRISTFLRQADRMTPDTRARLSRELAHEASPWVSPLPDTDAESFLTAIAAIRRDRDYTALLLERERLSRLSPVLTGLPHAFPDR
ncbi:RDD family protein [Planctomonas psychrotolerans]|uniref:RDD family protein n=1 Tax=Planctomonas psychrotolerans TaxID=2528712 RepID=UPI0012387893|nr:RDD family protein [Planctomonas psychrotolerans]